MYVYVCVTYPISLFYIHKKHTHKHTYTRITYIKRTGNCTPNTHTHIRTHTYVRTHKCALSTSTSPATLAHLVLQVKLGTFCDQLSCCLCVSLIDDQDQRCVPILQRQQTGSRASDAMPLAAGARVLQSYSRRAPPA